MASWTSWDILPNSYGVASLTLPSDYNSYRGMFLTAVYSCTKNPEEWGSDVSFTFSIKCGNKVKADIVLTAEDFKGWEEEGQLCSFSREDDGSVIFHAGDEFNFTSTYSEYFHLDRIKVQFTEAGDFRNYIFTYNMVYTAITATLTTFGNYYVTGEDYVKYINQWGPPSGYVNVHLDGTGTNYNSNVTYYTAEQTKEYLKIGGEKIFVIS